MKKKMMRVLALFVLLALVPALAFADNFAVVRGGRLNLRESASSSSRSLGKYGTGTWVRVDGYADSRWCAVTTLDGKRGYMDVSYLSFPANANTGIVRYANGGYVNLRSGPSLDSSVVTRVTSGMTVTILSDSYEWNQVSVTINGTTYSGYMHDSFIDRGGGTAYVSTRNGGRVNVRSGPSSSYASVTTLPTGTKVTVLLQGNGWSQITADGVSGFMSTTYLSSTGGNTGSSGGYWEGNGGLPGSSGTTQTRTAYVKNPRSTQVLNLREYPSQSARSLGQYRNGTQVKVVLYGSVWCEVYVGTRHGYMMTQYLSFDVSSDSLNAERITPTPAAPNYPVIPTPTLSPIPTSTPPLPPSMAYPTPTPTPGSSPNVGDSVTLMVADNDSSPIPVYNDAGLTSLKMTCPSGTQATLLLYGDASCMILLNGGVAYVATQYVWTATPK